MSTWESKDLNTNRRRATTTTTTQLVLGQTEVVEFTGPSGPGGWWSTWLSIYHSTDEDCEYEFSLLWIGPELAVSTDSAGTLRPAKPEGKKSLDHSTQGSANHYPSQPLANACYTYMMGSTARWEWQRSFSGKSVEFLCVLSRTTTDSGDGETLYATGAPNGGVAMTVYESVDCSGAPLWSMDLQNPIYDEPYLCHSQTPKFSESYAESLRLKYNFIWPRCGAPDYLQSVIDLTDSESLGAAVDDCDWANSDCVGCYHSLCNQASCLAYESKGGDAVSHCGTCPDHYLCGGAAVVSMVTASSYTAIGSQFNHAGPTKMQVLTHYGGPQDDSTSHDYTEEPVADSPATQSAINAFWNEYEQGTENGATWAHDGVGLAYDTEHLNGLGGDQWCQSQPEHFNCVTIPVEIQSTGLSGGSEMYAELDIFEFPKNPQSGTEMPWCTPAIQDGPFTHCPSWSCCVPACAVVGGKGFTFSETRSYLFQDLNIGLQMRDNGCYRMTETHYGAKQYFHFKCDCVQRLNTNKREIYDRNKGIAGEPGQPYNDFGKGCGSSIAFAWFEVVPYNLGRKYAGTYFSSASILQASRECHMTGPNGNKGTTWDKLFQKWNDVNKYNGAAFPVNSHTSMFKRNFDWCSCFDSSVTQIRMQSDVATVQPRDP